MRCMKQYHVCSFKHLIKTNICSFKIYRKNYRYYWWIGLYACTLGDQQYKTFLLPGKLLEILLPRAEILRCRALVNKIQHESEAPEGCANPGHHTRVYDSVQGRAGKLVFLTSSQVMVMLLIWTQIYFVTIVTGKGESLGDSGVTKISQKTINY